LQPPASVKSIAVISAGISCMECACMHAIFYIPIRDQSIRDFLSEEEQVFLRMCR
jgi:hypothetical protein